MREGIEDSTPAVMWKQPKLRYLRDYRLRGWRKPKDSICRETNSELQVFKEAQGKLMAQAIQRAMEGRTADEILREAMLETEEIRGKLAVAESRVLYEAKGKVEAQDRATNALKALLEEQESRVRVRIEDCVAVLKTFRVEQSPSAGLLTAV